MIDFNKIRVETFFEISKTNELKNLEPPEIANNNLSGFEEVWKLTTEVYLTGNKIEEVKILIAIPAEFPLIMPKFFLDGGDYDRIKYVPHINIAREICVFDEETITIDPRQPLQIIRLGLARARKVIEDGVLGENDSDFKDEFLAYWDDVYDTKDKFLKVLDMVSTPLVDSSKLKLSILAEKFAGYSAVLHNYSTEFNRFKTLIDFENIGSEVHPVMYLGETDFLNPPFYWTNQRIEALIDQKFPLKKKEFIRHINSKAKQAIFVFSMKVKHRWLYFGWIISHMPPPAGTGSWRIPPSNWDLFIKFHKTNPVIRLNSDIYTQERISLRTAGIIEESQFKKIAIAGLGSIGSHLIPYLLALGMSEIVLIDFDVLTLENINRHLLGFIHIGQHKTDALEIFIKENNPLLKITNLKKSIVQAINEDLEILNNSSYIFSVIGKTNIEDFIITALSENVLRKPLVILWIEPFLIGGHCLFIYPQSPIDYKSLFENGLFRYNIIDKSEYSNSDRQLAFKESGCQSSYIPYGRKDIFLFLSGLFPTICSEIESGNCKSKVISCRGSRAIQQKLNIQISAIGQSIAEGSLMITPLT